MKVDRETGGVAVERYVIAYDIGRAINPALVRGQIVGGFAQGLGGALLEEFTYNERGDPLATTFADYLMPTVRETPKVDVILREDYMSPLNPLGIKGAGESGITGVGAAIASAIDDAIGMPGAMTQIPGDAAAVETDLERARVGFRGEKAPDCASLHPGYKVPRAANEECPMTVADVRSAKRAAKKAPNEQTQAGPAHLDRCAARGRRAQEISGAERERRSAASSISTCARWAIRRSCSTTFPAIRAAIASWPTSSPRCGAST